MSSAGLNNIDMTHCQLNYTYNKIIKIILDKIVNICYHLGKMKTRLTIEISSEIKQEAKARAYGEGLTLKDKVTKLLLEWLQQRGNNE